MRGNVHKRRLPVCFQFLATLKIMDYSLLVGIHDVDRAEQEEMDVEGVGEEDEYENDGMGGGVLTGSFGTPPDSPGNPLNCGGFFGPGEFDSSVDVYAIKSHDGEGPLDPRGPSQRRASAVAKGVKRAVFCTRCCEEGGVLHGHHRHPHTLRCEEKSCTRCQNCETRGKFSPRAIAPRVLGSASPF